MAHKDELGLRGPFLLPHGRILRPTCFGHLHNLRMSRRTETAQSISHTYILPPEPPSA